MHRNSDHLVDKIMGILVANRQTRACSLRDMSRGIVHPDVKYHIAHLAKKRCLEKLDGKESDSFYLIPAHCAHILEQDPKAKASWSAPGGKFETLFVCPSASQDAYAYCRPIVAFDGTHTRCAHPQILLIATALDANNEIIPLAYCMVPTENPTEWNKFLHLIRSAIPLLCKPGTVFISDREKGLKHGLPEMFPAGYFGYCTWHLGENVLKNTKCKEIRKIFDQMPYATTSAKWKSLLDKIAKKNPTAAKYVENTAHLKHYSRAYFPTPRYDIFY
jgi:hypothetical protein